MRELLKERRTTKVEGWRGTDAAEGDVTQKAASGSQSGGWSQFLKLLIHVCCFGPDMMHSVIVVEHDE